MSTRVYAFVDESGNAPEMPNSHHELPNVLPQADNPGDGAVFTAVSSASHDTTKKLVRPSYPLPKVTTNGVEQQDTMRKNNVVFGIITAAFLFGCSTAQKAFTVDQPAASETVDASASEPIIPANQTI